MRIIILFLLFFPLLFNSQRNKTIKDQDVTFIYKNTIKPSGESGVLGMQSKKAFAIFVNESLPADSIIIFSQVNFGTLNFGHKKSKIYLCIYENNNGLPGKILNSAKILVNIPRKKTDIIVDISKRKIPVPKSGYFVGLEWLIQKENIIYGEVKTQKPPYNPAILGLANGKYELYVLNENWQKAEEILISSLKLEISYLSNLH